MKSNKPITKEITIPLTFDEGKVLTTETKEVLFDRLCINLSIGASENTNAPIKQSVAAKIRKCSEDGHITEEDAWTFVIGNIANCTDIDVLTCFGKIDAALTELVNKKGL